MSDLEPIHVDAGGWGLTWAADRDARLRQVGVGVAGHHATVDVDPIWYPDAHPVAGRDALRPPALRVTHADGTLTTRPAVSGVVRAAETDGEHVVVITTDELFDLTVEHHVRTHPASGVLEQWIEVHHAEAGPVTVHEYDSISPLLLVGPDATITQFGGSGWADEWSWCTEHLTPGTKVLDSLGGIQPHLQRSPCLLLAPGQSGERDGEVLGVSVAWGGNVRFALDVRPKAEAGAPRELRLRAGANPAGAPYVLDPGARFVAPSVLWTWSDRGRAEVSRRFHAWTRARGMRDPDLLRPIVANNWEATFFDFDEARLVGLIGRAADVGADLFLLDDGWFGTTFPRDDDTQGLGDWEPDRAKLPNGLAPLVTACEERGIRFGIWVEPEMVNPRSELAAAHPDWVIRDERDPQQHRNQWALDPLVPEVREFEVDVVSRTLASAPGTAYVQWDANRPITDPGSTALARDRQANLWIDHVRATWEVMATVASRHPDVLLMLCASGGGRTDHGSLRWFHEVWTSDNTDPITRVRMQWAASHFFPLAALAAHVTRWGERPLPFACAVALSARFGFDLDLASLSEADLAVCQRAVEVARLTQPAVQHGVLERLVSPVEGPDRDRAALACHQVDGARSVVFAYQLADPTQPGPRLVVRGLDPDARYRVATHDLVSEPLVSEMTGAHLLEGALDWPEGGACAFGLWVLDRID